MSELTGVTVSGTKSGAWVVSLGRTALQTFCEGGAEARARKYAAEVERQVRAGTWDASAPRGVCALGHSCDRGRVNVPLRDLTDELLLRVRLCPGHLAEARPGEGSGKPGEASSPAGGTQPSPAGPGAPSPGRRRRKAAGP